MKACSFKEGRSPKADGVQGELEASGKMQNYTVSWKLTNYKHFKNIC